MAVDPYSARLPLIRLYGRLGKVDPRCSRRCFPWKVTMLSFLRQGPSGPIELPLKGLNSSTSSMSVRDDFTVHQGTSVTPQGSLFSTALKASRTVSLYVPLTDCLRPFPPIKIVWRLACTFHLKKQMNEPFCVLGLCLVLLECICSVCMRFFCEVFLFHPWVGSRRNHT